MRRTRLVDIFTTMQDEDDDQKRCLPETRKPEMVRQRMMVPVSALCKHSWASPRDGFLPTVDATFRDFRRSNFSLFQLTHFSMCIHE